jgi:hypothetical protein
VNGRLALATAIVVVPLVGYPLLTLTGGRPRFPTRAECAQGARPGNEPVEVVYGRFDDPVAANELLSRVVGLGFVGTELAFEPCGRWKVRYDSVASFEQALALAREAREAGLDPRVESGG